MTESPRHDRLRRRAELMADVRSFFDKRGFLEVETPLLCREIIPELHIEPMAVTTAAPESSAEAPAREVVQWLQASPELHMKRLVAEGLEAIYQIGKSFRRGERGRWHRPEFTIVEWYRIGDDMRAGIDLLDELCQQLLGVEPATRTTYAEAFQRIARFDPHTETIDGVADQAARLGVSAAEGMARSDRDEWLNLLLAAAVEPQLGRDRPEIVYDYPASQAALASVRATTAGPAVAERFELYWRGVELANGYHELTDARELRRRLEQVNVRRRQEGRIALPLPESLLAAMQRGLPPCAGCALGFDRLVMLACNAQSIDEVAAME